LRCLRRSGNPRFSGGGKAGEARVRFVRQRPGTFTPGAPLEGVALSRRQLVVTSKNDALVVENVGRCEFRVNGVRSEAATVRPGDTLYLRRQLLMLCTRRAAFIPKWKRLLKTSAFRSRCAPQEPESLPHARPQVGELETQRFVTLASSR
jgi:hypothetical protein